MANKPERIRKLEIPTTKPHRIPELPIRAMQFIPLYGFGGRSLLILFPPREERRLLYGYW